MNEHLTERFGRGVSLRNTSEASSGPRPPLVTNHSIRKYVKAFDRPVDLLDWTHYREIPVNEEVFASGSNNESPPIEVSANVVVGPYESKNDYLERHYTLLREDGVAPLRNVISEMQACPSLEEKDSRESAMLYEKVCFEVISFQVAAN